MTKPYQYSRHVINSHVISDVRYVVFDFEKQMFIKNSNASKVYFWTKTATERQNWTKAYSVSNFGGIINKLFVGRS